MCNKKPNIPNGNCIIKHYAGSISYGTNHENSDIDFRGIFIAEPIFLTPFYSYKEYVDLNEEDSKYFELSNYFELAAKKSNPNLLETLWVDKSDIVYSNEVYDFIRDIREEFLSKKVAIVSANYALNALKRSENKSKWINKPQPKEKPKQFEFVSMVQNFTEDKIFKINLLDFKNNWRLVPYGDNIYGLIRSEGYSTFDDLGNLNTVYQNNKNNKELPEFIVKFNKELYLKAKEDHKGYWDWKNNRNEKRLILEEKNGYDTKDAMHLIRLLKMSKEILIEETLHVKRKDYKELLDIKNGIYNYSEIKEMAEVLKQEVIEANKKSKLKEEPDFKVLSSYLVKANSISKELTNRVYKKRKYNN